MQAAILSVDTALGLVDTVGTVPRAISLICILKNASEKPACRSPHKRIGKPTQKLARTLGSGSVIVGLKWSLLGDMPGASLDFIMAEISHIPKTFGDERQAGRVWICRHGAATGSGHLFILIDVGGHSTFEQEHIDIPSIFRGLQLHIGLEEDEKRRRTRMTELRSETWHSGGPHVTPMPSLWVRSYKLP